MPCPENEIVNNCSGAIGSGDVLFDYWQTHNCPAAYSQAINTTSTGQLAYNSEAQICTQSKIVELFDTYLKTNKLTDDVTSSEYNPFQNTLLALCVNPALPGICTEFLTGYCHDFTREDAINSPTLTNFCGCYVPPDPVYLKYTLGSAGCQTGSSGCTAGCTAGEAGCTGQPACDPLCHRALTSQKSDVETGNFITCPQNVCVIDDVVINASDTTVAGGINFNTVCSGCVTSSGCICVVSGINVSDTMGNIGITTNFNEFCGASSVCIIEDDFGNIISATGCTGISSANMSITTSSSAANIGVIVIVIICVILIFIMALTARFSTITVINK